MASLNIKVSILDGKEFLEFVKEVASAMDDAPEPIKTRVLEAYNKLVTVRNSQKEEQDAQEC